MIRFCVSAGSTSDFLLLAVLRRRRYGGVCGVVSADAAAEEEAEARSDVSRVPTGPVKEQTLSLFQQL